MVKGHRRKFNKVGNDLAYLIPNDEVIKRLEKTKYMRINMVESLNWKVQYKAVQSKFKRGISSLRKLKNILPRRKLEQVYKALFDNSHLCYGDII